MRAILGTPDKPGSSYILVIRGLDEKSIGYFMRHVKRYPTWGCLVFSEEGEILTSPEGIVPTPIHKVFVDKLYISVSDDTLIKWVKEAFPPYREDDDPVLDREQLLMDAIKGSSEALETLAEHFRNVTKIQ